MGDNMYKISYVADGTETEFTFSFPFFQCADVCVAINGAICAPEYNFSIIPNEDFSGGNVVFDVAPDADTKIDIFRQISLSRVIDYQPTKTIDPDDLNADFNFLLAAFQDLQQIDVDISECRNKYDDIKRMMDYTQRVIEDKMSGGTVLGLYRNLVSVLEDALPKLINDYGLITEPAINENNDDYGVL